MSLARRAPDLVTQAMAGDALALDRLLAATQPDLRRYAARSCAADDVDEAVQDALWVLSRNVRSLRSATALGAWLFQVVKRACLRLLMRRRRHDHDALADDAATIADTTELRLSLACVLARLPAAYREAVILADVQGLSGAELAQALGIGLDAAKSRLHRARSMVREAMQEAAMERTP